MLLAVFVMQAWIDYINSAQLDPKVTMRTKAFYLTEFNPHESPSSSLYLSFIQQNENRINQC